MTTLVKSINSILLKNISWQTYESLLKDMEEQPGIKLTYDQGQLELMTPLDPHESYAELFGRFVIAITEELNIEMRSLGSRTCKREDLARGLEPDKCYYIQNELIVRNKEQINLNQDPPPDLVIEIDITSSSINRLELYRALGVPEVWRYDERKLIIYRLESGVYKECNHSPTFPQITPAEIMRFLEMRKTMGETSLIREFRQWMRSKL